MKELVEREGMVAGGNDWFLSFWRRSGFRGLKGRDEVFKVFGVIKRGVWFV